VESNHLADGSWFTASHAFRGRTPTPETTKAAWFPEAAFTRKN
jgi:hypothetical protein